MKKKLLLQNISIFSKIKILTVAFIILCSVVSNAIILLQFSENLKHKDRLLVREAAERIEDYVQDIYNMMYNQRTLLHSTGYIADVIATTREHPSDIYQSNNLTKITDYLSALGYSNNRILDAILFTADGQNAFSYSPVQGRKVYLGYDYIDLPYIKAFREADTNITSIYDTEPPYLTLSSSKKPKEVITFIAKLYDMSYPTKKITTGYLMVNFSPASIDQTYNEIEASSDGVYYIVNADSDIIYSNRANVVGQTYLANMIQEKDVILSNSVSLSGIRIIGVVSDQALQRHVNTLILQMLLITGISILCLVVATTLLQNYYGRKFQRLAYAMDHISKGDFSTRLPVHSKDEIGYLSQTFNTMCETLDMYIKKTYLAETKKRTAELYALQTQINPHFLANTIESIRMQALSQGNYEVSEMLANLGNLFRWMIQFHQDIVYLEDEVDYIESYLDLQKFRFGDKVLIEMNVPPETLYLGIPKFTLQPIVENAITHGELKSGTSLIISINFQIKDDLLMIIIKDNGQGMKEDMLIKLRQHITGGKTFPEFGIALRNVHTRIQLLFGEGYGLSIKSALYQGTTIEVTLPAKNKKEMELYV